MSYIHKIITRVFYLIRLVCEYCILSYRQQRVTLPKGSKSIVITLDEENLYRDNDGDGRYAYLLLNRFSEGGYNIYFYKHVSLKGFAALRKYGRLIYSIRNLKFTTKIPADTQHMVYAFDTIHEALLEKTWRKLTYINILRPSFCKIGKMLNIPYYFHPFIYQSHSHHHLERLRDNTRRMRVFFGGNTVEEGYTNNRYHDLRIYNDLTRLEGLQVALNTTEPAKMIDDINEFYRFLESDEPYANTCYILQTDKGPSMDNKEWLNTISRSDFFLCLSGVELPMCHHSIEAMAVGTIPIISHPHWFFPSLEHKKNAIIYSGQEDLRRKLDEVFAMPPQEIERMRTNVIEFYNKFLSTESFITRYEGLTDTIGTIMMHPHVICKDKENIRARRFIKRLKEILEISEPSHSQPSAPFLNFT
jgi:hypothetical protein